MTALAEAFVKLRLDDSTLGREVRMAVSRVADQADADAYKGGVRLGSSVARGMGSGVSKDNAGLRKFLTTAFEGFGDVASRMSKVITVGGFMGPAMMAVASAFSAAAAGATALVGTIGPAAIGSAAGFVGVMEAGAQGMGTFKFATAGLTEALGGNKKALDALTPAGKALVKTLNDLKPAVNEVRSSAQAGLFPGLEGATRSLATNYLPLLNVAARQTGTELGSLATQGAAMANSGPWKKDFQTVTTANAVNLGLMGQVAMSLANVARNLLVTAAPLTRAFLTWAAGAADATDKMIQAKRASGALDDFWKRTLEDARQIGRILGDLGVALYNVFKIGADPTGLQLLDSVETMTQDFREWTGSASGAAQIAGWFATGRDNLSAMARLVKEVFGGLVSIGSGSTFAPLTDQITKEIIPPLMEFLRNASASGALPALVSAISNIIKVFAELEKGDSSVKAFSVTLNTLAQSVAWILKNIPGASSALGAFLTVAGGAAALRFAGLGGVVRMVGTGFATLAARILTAAGAETTETGAVTFNTLAHQASRSTIGTWLGVKALEIQAWIKSAAMAVAHTARMVLSRAAMLAVAAATKAWSVAQWILNAALTANPIGLVIAAVAALALGVIYAYKHSETFRKIVSGAFDVISRSAQGMWNMIVGAFAGILDGFLTFAGVFVHLADKAFGWIPLLKGPLHEASKGFDNFHKHAVDAINNLKGKTIKITYEAAYLVQGENQGHKSGGSKGLTLTGANVLATGGQVRGPGTATSDSIPAWLSNGEHVLTAKEVQAAGGHGMIEMWRRSLVRRAKGGSVETIDVKVQGELNGMDAVNRANRTNISRIQQTLLAPLNMGLNFAYSQAGKPYLWGGVGPFGYDCSGFMSAIANVILGENPYKRRFATSTMTGAGTGGFAPGGGGFSIGILYGFPGHTAGTLLGTNVESRGGDGVVVGPRARGARNSLFSALYHLKGFARGGMVGGDGPFDLMDPRGKHKRKKIDPRDLIDVKSFDTGGWLKPGWTLAHNGTGLYERVGRYAGGGIVADWPRGFPSMPGPLPNTKPGDIVIAVNVNGKAQKIDLSQLQRVAAAAHKATTSLGERLSEALQKKLDKDTAASGKRIDALKAKYETLNAAAAKAVEDSQTQLDSLRSQAASAFSAGQSAVAGVVNVAELGTNPAGKLATWANDARRFVAGLNGMVAKGLPPSLIQMVAALGPTTGWDVVQAFNGLDTAGAAQAGAAFAEIGAFATQAGKLTMDLAVPPPLLAAQEAQVVALQANANAIAANGAAQIAALERAQAKEQARIQAAIDALSQDRVAVLQKSGGRILFEIVEDERKKKKRGG